MLCGWALAACSQPTPTIEPTDIPATVTPTPAPTATATLVPDPPALPIDLTEVGPITPTVPINTLTVLGLTYQQSDGNRVANGTGAIGFSTPVDLVLDGIPAWVVGVPVDGGGSIWSAVLTDGRVQSFMQINGNISAINVMPNRLPPGMPPAIVIHRGAPRLLTGPEADASPLSHPVVIGTDPANFAYIANNGDLVVNKGGEVTRLPINALPDGRILLDGTGRLLILAGATGRYAHGVLGDALEAGSIAIVNTDPVEVTQVIDVSPGVIEGISAIWVDTDGDEMREILVTVSDDVEGAKLVVYEEDGSINWQSEPVGRGYRWRHQLVVTAFEAGTGTFIAENVTPHIGGITEFLPLSGADGPVLLSELEGFSTHRLGSRNLDMALAGDLDGDGVTELMIPSENGEYLGAFQMRGGAAYVAWTVRIPAPLSTNLAGVTLLDGNLAIGAGFQNGILRLWLP